MNKSVLIIGSGITGLAAAVCCSKAGVRAIVVEQSAIVGGKLAASLVVGVDGSADANLVYGEGLPNLDELSALAGEDTVDKNQVDENGATGIEIFTLADVERLEGEPGDFTVSILERARFVTDACTRCNNCPQVCPQVTANEFDAGLSFRKAIYTPMQQTLPGKFVIDIESCLNTPPNYLPCQRCVEVCDDNAIDFSMNLERRHQRQVTAVIIAAGFESAVSADLQEFGYGMHPDVVTSMELQRLLQSPGPTGGFVAKPSDEEYPERILLVLHGNSDFSAFILSNQIRRLVDQGIEEIFLLLLDQKGAGAELETLETIATEAGITLCRGVWVGIREADNRLCAGYVDLATGLAIEQVFDMVVLSSDLQPPRGLAELATTLEVSLAGTGYIETLEGDQGDDGSPPSHTATSRPGIYAAGCATGPLSMAQSLVQARTAVQAAVTLCSPELSRTETAELEQPRWPDLTEVEQQLRIEGLLESLIMLGEGDADGPGEG
jgi:heterodisulfide reductase subunit A